MSKFRSLPSAALLPALTFFLSLAALLLPARPLRAEADGRELLARIGVVAVEKNFRGKKMVVDFSRLTPQVTNLSIVYQLGGKERREYAASQGLVVIDGNYFYQYYPRKKLIVRKKLPNEGGYESLRKENLKRALESYELVSSPSDRIAGRKTHLYEFRPRQPGTRPLRKIWVDVETGLILRMELYSPDDQLFWLSVFEDVDYDYEPQVTPASFTMPVPEGVRIVESNEGECLEAGKAEEVSGLPLALPDYLPAGFTRQCIRAKQAGGFGEIQIVYSDGLSLVSLFESSRFRSLEGNPQGRKVTVGDYEATLQRAGLVTALSWRAAKGHMTILGEISREEMLKVAESISSPRELSRP